MVIVDGKRCEKQAAPKFVSVTQGNGRIYAAGNDGHVYAYTYVTDAEGCVVIPVQHVWLRLDFPAAVEVKSG